MTMLDRMRRHRNWLKWSLALVCLAFVIFYIPDFLRGDTTDATGLTGGVDTIAVVQGQNIRATEFQRTYQAQIEAYRQAYGGKMSEQLLKQLGIENQILQTLVDERASVAEADRLGLRVTDEEVRQRILSLPAFQENGAFIGDVRYQQILRSQRPPIVPAEFEESVRRSLAIEKLRSSLTEWMSIPDTELEQEYRRRNDKVKVSYVTFPADKYKADVKVTDAQVASHFEAHKDDFKVPEKRKVRFLLVDLEQLKAKAAVPQADIERAYNDLIDQYSTPDQVRASHILLKIAGDEEAVKTKAADIVKQARGGADFAALAKKYSEDTASAKNGGDLDYFGRGQMVPEFDTAVFAMEPGQISDPVKTAIGYEVIKLVDKKAGIVRPLAEVRPQINDQLASAKAQSQADQLAQTLQGQIKKAADLETVAKAQGLAVQESGFFTKDEPMLAVGGSPEVASRAFDLKDGEVSSAIRTPRGYVFETVTAKQDAYVPKFEDVKDTVKEALVTSTARDLARQAASAVEAKLKAAPDFEKAAKAAGLDVKTTDLVTRDQPLGELGTVPDASAAAFRLDKGALSGPVTVGTGVALLKVVDKVETTPAELAAQKDAFREELLGDQRNRFFSAYMGKARQKMKIDVNRDALQRVVG